MRFHDKDIEELYKIFKTGPQGLHEKQASEILNRVGFNQIQSGTKKSFLVLLFKQFQDFMILVLLCAALVSAFVSDFTDSIIILVIICINALIGFVQEYRAEKAMEALREMITTHAKVIRDGHFKIIPSENLVPGDIIQLEAGDLIPADVRLTEAHGFKTEEAVLTGESVPVEKFDTTLHERNLIPADRKNIAFKGTYATSGRARGIVVATGMKTEFGKIAAMLEQPSHETPLQKRLRDFSKKLTIFILLICLGIFILGYLRGEPPLQMLLTSISLAVAAIPEALPAVITLSLAFGARRLSRQNALIRNLPAVETLGSVTYICTDKTGTLTINKMQVLKIFDGQKVISLNELKSTNNNSFNDPLMWLTKAMALSNDVEENAEGILMGESTEIGLVQAAQSLGYLKKVLSEQYQRIGEIPFESDRKRMSTLHKKGENIIIFTKGAPDVLIELSLLSPDEKIVWKKQAEDLAAQGFRVIGLGFRSWENSELGTIGPHLENEISMLGLAAMIDPPRPEVRHAVKECQEAGIIPVMITGDHPLTAQAIAREVGIATQETEILTGRELEETTSSELRNKVLQTRVYSRVSPTQKLKIVEALQAEGQFVAMTGDGVNDAPSLKKADIGVAMGITGTEVSKEASDMILLDDNFSTIVNTVKEGRRIYDNIRKFIKYTMTSNSGEIWTILLAPIFGLPVPLLPVHILWINLVTDGLPGLALASEKSEKNIMRRPPRHPRESIFAKGLGPHVIWVGLLMGIICIITESITIKFQLESWQTMVFTVLCFSQIGHAFAIRSESEYLYRTGLFTNKSLLGAALLTALLQISIIYIPFFNPIFKTTPLSIQEFIVTILLSAIVFHAVEFEKWLKKVYNN